MSLMKWLTAGKSLVFWHKSEPKYRVVEESFLPKFGGPSGIVGGNPVGNPMPDNDAGLAPGSIFYKNGAVTGGHPVVLKALAHESSANGKVVTRLVASEEKKQSEPTRPGTKHYRRLVQSELSLDGVKVVRNDLVDADLEVVRVKPAAKPVEPVSLDGLFGGGEGARTPSESEESERPGVRVGRLFGRWFGGALPEQA